MKRLMLDYLRRKGWILAGGAVLELVIGWFAASNANPHGSPSIYFAHAFAPVFSVFQFQITLFMGVLLLQFDMQRGMARTVAVLPLTALQIGRAWWLVSVGIPAIALSALFFLGAVMFGVVHPNSVFPLKLLAMGSLFTLLWLGSAFPVFFLTRCGFYGSGWRRARNLFFGILWGALVGGGFLLFQGWSENPIKAAIFGGVGGVLTLVGWFCAGHLVQGRASFHPGAMQDKDPRGQHRAPGGYGGISLLLSTMFIRTFRLGLAMVALVGLIMALQGHVKSWREAIEPSVGSIFPFFFFIFLPLIPALLQLRFLRTLPISVTRLAVVMVAMAILPLVALAALVGGITGLSLGTAAAITVLKSYAVLIALASLSIFFAVWLGVGQGAYALMFLTFIGFQTTPLWLDMYFHYHIPSGLADLIVGISVPLVFLLTRRALGRGSKAYRTPAGVLAKTARGA